MPDFIMHSMWTGPKFPTWAPLSNRVPNHFGCALRMVRLSSDDDGLFRSPNYIINGMPAFCSIHCSYSASYPCLSYYYIEGTDVSLALAWDEETLPLDWDRASLFFNALGYVGKQGN